MKSLALLAAVALLTNRHGGSLVADATPPAQPSDDAGQPVQLTLGSDYHCAEASEPIEYPDGGVMVAVPRGAAVLFPDRIQRVNCELTGCQVERDALRADGGSAWTTSHTLLSVAGVLTTVLTLYAENRTARHLSLIP